MNNGTKIKQFLLLSLTIHMVLFLISTGRESFDDVGGKIEPKPHNEELIITFIRKKESYEEMLNEQTKSLMSKEETREFLNDNKNICELPFQED